MLSRKQQQHSSLLRLRRGQVQGVHLDPSLILSPPKTSGFAPGRRCGMQSAGEASLGIRLGACSSLLLLLLALLLHASMTSSDDPSNDAIQFLRISTPWKDPSMTYKDLQQSMRPDMDHYTEQSLSAIASSRFTDVWPCLSSWGLERPAARPVVSVFEAQSQSLCATASAAAAACMLCQQSKKVCKARLVARLLRY